MKIRISSKLKSIIYGNPVTFTKRSSIIFILFFACVLVIDSTIVKYYSYSEFSLSPASNVLIFDSIFIIFVVSTTVLLNSVVKNIPDSFRKMKYLNFSNLIIWCSQIITIGIMTILIGYISCCQKYNVDLLNAATIVTHLSTLILMIPIIYFFIEWLKIKRNYMIFLFSVAFILLFTSITLSFIFLELQYLFTYFKDRKAFPIYLFMIRQETSPLSVSLKTYFDIMSLASFFTMWLATASLLNQYKKKFGKFRYYVTICIPLFYYLFPLQSYFGNVLSSVMTVSPLMYGISYVLVFSATREVGAVLFSISFITATSYISVIAVKKSMFFTAIGIAIIFGSIDIDILQYRLYPPYGSVTQAFMPLGAYMLFVGLYISAKSVSRDIDLRRELYKSVESQLHLLKTMGSTQMENELVKKFKYIENRTRKSSELNYDLNREEIHNLVREVMDEVKKSKNPAV